MRAYSKIILSIMSPNSGKTATISGNQVLCASPAGILWSPPMKRITPALSRARRRLPPCARRLYACHSTLSILESQRKQSTMPFPASRANCTDHSSSVRISRNSKWLGRSYRCADSYHRAKRRRKDTALCPASRNLPFRRCFCHFNHLLPARRIRIRLPQDVSVTS